MTGWFNFPPHEDTEIRKIAIYGWGYTRTPSETERSIIKYTNGFSPPVLPCRERPKFAPADAEGGLRDGPTRREQNYRFRIGNSGSLCIARFFKCPGVIDKDYIPCVGSVHNQRCCILLRHKIGFALVKYYSDDTTLKDTPWTSDVVLLTTILV